MAYPATLGGLDGADAKCNAAAQAASLPGTFKAWLSDGYTDAISRLADVGPWYRVGASVVAFEGKAKLTSPPLASLAFDERGTALASGEVVWTGTASDGTRANDLTVIAASDKECAGWTDITGADTTAGNPTATTSDWTQMVLNDVACVGSTLHLYCFQQ
jgi:hypothetical protein